MFRITHFILFIFPLALGAQNGLDTSSYIKSSYHVVEPLGSNVNSEWDELAPHRYATKLYFSKLPKYTQGLKLPSRVHTAIENGQNVPLSINPTDDQLQMAYSALTNTGQRIYYTLFQEGPNGKAIKSQLWFRDKDFNGKWGPPTQMPRWFAQNGNRVSQPATGIFRDTRSEELFFI